MAALGLWFLKRLLCPVKLIVNKQISLSPCPFNPLAQLKTLRHKGKILPSCLRHPHRPHPTPHNTHARVMGQSPAGSGVRVRVRYLSSSYSEQRTRDLLTRPEPRLCGSAHRAGCCSRLPSSGRPRVLQQSRQRVGLSPAQVVIDAFLLHLPAQPGGAWGLAPDTGGAAVSKGLWAESST